MSAEPADNPALEPKTSNAEFVLSIPSIPSIALDLPHFDQYAGAWAMHLPTLMALRHRLTQMDLALHIHQGQANAATGQGESTDGGARPRYQVIDGVAVFDAVGTITKYGSSFSPYAGSVNLRRAVRQARLDRAVSGGLMRIDSGGGTMAGTGDLADELRAFRAEKPLVTFIEDLGASAAYWLAAQGSTVLANPSAIIGALGTYAILEDTSAEAARAGIKVIIVKAGEFKGAGEWGTSITPEQVATFQALISQLNEVFLSGVALGRNRPIDEIRRLADGRAHGAAAALELGLIDGMGSLNDAMAAAMGLVEERSKLNPRATGRNLVSRRTHMDGSTSEETVPVNPEDLRSDGAKSERQRFDALMAAYPQDPAFVTEQYRAGANAEQAALAWQAKQAAQAKADNERLTQELTATKKELDELKAKFSDGCAPAAMKPGGTPAAGDRMGIVAKARAEYVEACKGGNGKVLCSESDWINGTLIQRQLPRLTDEEARSLAISN